MKIISWNVNGLRAVLKNNFLQWLKSAEADIFCFQEIKAQEKDLVLIIDKIAAAGNFQFYFNFADKPGYSGVAVLAKVKPLKVKTKLGLKRFDKEGRFLELQFSDFTLINVYIPHGGRQKENLDYKLEVYGCLLRYLKSLKGKGVILVGDLNIAHQEIDLARPKQNQKNIMFTPEERAQIDEIIRFGFVDTFRQFESGGGHYTWWPYFVNARARNLGWRIDYCFASQNLAPRVKDAFILPDVFGSDHCPVGIII